MNRNYAELLKLCDEEAAKIAHLPRPIASIDVSREGQRMSVHLNTSQATYGEWIPGEGADIALHRDMDTKRLAGADLPLYAKTLMVSGDFGTITIDLESGEVKHEK